MKRLWYYPKSFWIYLLVALVFGTILIVFFISLQKDSNLATPVLAFATVILALATVLIIINTNEQEKRRRKEDLLKEIIDWATDILICGRDISREFFKELVKDSTSYRAPGIELEVQAKFNVISWRGVYIRHISSNLNKTLYDKVLDTQKILRQHVKIMELEFMGKIKNNSTIGKHRDILDSSAKLLIEECVNLLS